MTEKHAPVAVVVPPRDNLLNGVPEMNVLMLDDPLRLVRGCGFKKDFPRVGVFNPASQV
jgi:hypothetical protein